MTLDLEPDEWLRIMRSRLELTQGELAARLGVSRKTLSGYEQGLYKISQARMRQIMQLTEMT